MFSETAANNSLKDFSFYWTPNLLTGDPILGCITTSNQMGMPDYYIHFSPQSLPCKIDVVHGSLTQMTFVIRKGEKVLHHRVDGELDPTLVAGQELAQALLSALIKANPHGFSPPPPATAVPSRLSRPVKPVTPTAREIERAERERRLLEQEEAKRPQPAGCLNQRAQDPALKAIRKKMISINTHLDEDILYLNRVVKNKNQPSAPRANQIIQHIQELQNIEKQTAFSSLPNSTLLIAKRKSLEFLLLESFNKFTWVCT